MNAEEIRQAINEGKKVFWRSMYYEVIKDNLEQYFIRCVLNDHCIGLTHLDGVTLNGNESDFYIGND